MWRLFLSFGLSAIPSAQIISFPIENQSDLSARGVESKFEITRRSYRTAIVMDLNLYDAHNHLQDARLKPAIDSIMQQIKEDGQPRAVVVNGSCEADWPDVLALARKFQWIIPSFGIHPWYVEERSSGWQHTLRSYLDKMPSAIGEIGLDRWIKDFDFEAQEEVFVRQLELAKARQTPVSIHCIQAWGRMLELLQASELPSGFVLHSFGGPKEMIPAFTELGGYFSLPGYFAHQRKLRQRETFLHVPSNRLLIETDAPDQLLPAERADHALSYAQTGKPLNHPSNLAAVYRFAAELFQEPLEILTKRVEENFKRLFGKCTRS